MAIVTQRVSSFAIGALVTKLDEDHGLPLDVEVFGDLEKAVAWAIEPTTRTPD